MEHLKRILDTHIGTLSGVAITVSSIVTCVVIFLVGAIIAKFAKAGVRRAILARGRPMGIANAVSKIVWYFVFGLSAFVALDNLGISLTAVFAGSAVLLVGIGLGLQGLAQNFVAGFAVLIERPVKEGDFIRVGNVHGTVVRIGFRGTHVVSRDEVTVIIPNNELVTQQVVNLSVPTPRVRLTVRVGVAYGSDVGKVQQALLDAAAGEQDLLSSPPAEVRFENFGESALDFTLLAWLSDPAEDERVASRLRCSIDALFRERGIEIAFPQRDLHIRSGLDNLARTSAGR